MDEDDKVRRNLVVFSAAVCLFTFIQLPIAQVVSGTLKGAGQWTPDPWRLWAVVLVVLIYLFMRYRFSENFSPAFAPMLGDITNAIVERSKDRAVKCFENGQRGRSTRKFGFDLSAISEGLQENISHKTGERADWIQYGYRIDRQDRFKGVLTISLLGVKGSPGEIRETLERAESRIEYELPKVERARVVVTAVLQSSIYSRHFVTHSVPVLLGSAALLLSVVKLVQSV